MANLLTSFNSGVSGLHAAQSHLTVTSHNLANAHTIGYTRQQVMVTDSFYRNSYGANGNLMQLGTGTTVRFTRQIRNEFLDGQYRLQVGRQQFYYANAKATMEIEDMLGELHGREFQESITELWSAINDIAEDPSDIVKKDQLVMMATMFAERAQVLQDELNTYQTSLNMEVKRQVEDINKIVTEIKALNKQIQKFEATGESANDYRDRRNELLDTLGNYINFEVNEEIDGTITIYTEGTYLLDSVNQYFLTTEYESGTSKLLKPVWETGGDFFLRDSLEYSSSNNTDVGGLRGLLVARGNYSATYINVPQKPNREDFEDEDAYNRAMSQFQDDLEVYNKTIGSSIVMSVQSQLDTLIHGIVTAVNNALCPDKEITIQVMDEDGNPVRDDNGDIVTRTIRVLDEENALIGDDANKSVGVELFSRRGMQRYTQEDVTVVNEDGSTSTMTVYRYNEENPEDITSLYTTSQLIVNPTVAKDASTLPTMYNEASGDKKGYANNEWGAIGQAFDNDIGTLNPNSMTTFTAKTFYIGMITELSTQGNVWNGIIDNQDTTVTTLDNERQNVMGVATDEELSDLIKYQQCYNASSRYITTVSQMLEYLIERLGS